MYGTWWLQGYLFACSNRDSVKLDARLLNWCAYLWRFEGTHLRVEWRVYKAAFNYITDTQLEFSVDHENLVST